MFACFFIVIEYMFSVLLFCFLDKPPTNYKNLQIYGKKNETLRLLG